MSGISSSQRWLPHARPPRAWWIRRYSRIFRPKSTRTLKQGRRSVILYKQWRDKVGNSDSPRCLLIPCRSTYDVHSLSVPLGARERPSVSHSHPSLPKKLTMCLQAGKYSSHLRKQLLRSVTQSRDSKQQYRGIHITSTTACGRGSCRTL